MAEVMRQIDEYEAREIIGRWIRSERTERLKLSRAEFVAHLKSQGIKRLSPSAVRWYEEGNQMPKPSLLVALLRALDTEPPECRMLLAARVCLDVSDFVELLSDACGSWDVLE